MTGRTKCICILFLVGVLVFLEIPGSVAQVATGTPQFNSFGGGPFDTVNLGNLNAHFRVPIIHKAGRGLPFDYFLNYDSAIWTPVGSGGTRTWQPATNWGWQSNWGSLSGYLDYQQQAGQCFGSDGHPNGSYWVDFNYKYHDPSGHVVSYASYTASYLGGCSGMGTSVSGFTEVAKDGSGYTINISNPFTNVIDPNGRVINSPPFFYQSQAYAVTKSDSNGNQATESTTGVFTDTLNTTALKVTGTNPVTFAYTSPSGSQTYTMHYTTKTVKTAFGCSAVPLEYGPMSIGLVSDITLPDGSKYLFTYEPTNGFPGDVTGRLQSVTLPTGGTITYTYGTPPANLINCSDGSASTMTRQLSPGGTWTYSHANVSGSHWNTTITDPVTPVGNQTVIDFQKDSATYVPTTNFYETQRVVHQGGTGGATLQTQIICYNAPAGAVRATSCPTTATVSSPISRETVFSYLPDTFGKQSETDTFYSTNIPGLVSEVDEYDYASTGSGVGTLTRKTLLTYGNSAVPYAVTQMQIQDGSGNTIAETNNSYDESAAIGTTGTPHHATPFYEPGNLTTSVQVTSAAPGGSALKRKFVYYDTGNLYTSTDVGQSPSTGATTTYVYDSATSCGNSFPTQIQEPLSLSRSITWDCNGGVSLQVTDENGKYLNANYTDPYFWRPANVLDQNRNQTLFAYSSSPPAVESSLTFNSGSSVANSRMTVDGFGRPILNQRAQTPSLAEYDTSETDYNVSGQPSRSTMLFQSPASATSSTAPGTAVIYDALGRPTTVADGGGGTVSYSYTNNDVLQTVGPTQNFSKQLEYDGLGRLSSVCEITSAAGSGPCGQTNTKTGYWTEYTYNALNEILTVTQNAQVAAGGQQKRSFAYDLLGRLTSEVNPETGNNGVAGTVNYTYDAACATTPASPGDLTKKVDSAGNITCFAYDSLHRLTDAGYQGPTCRRFKYDTQTPPTGIIVSNTLGRMTEASTDNCGTTKLTDEWFGYDPDGNLLDFYESTPNSGGYYHSSGSYWANGALGSLSAAKANATAIFPTISYGTTGAGLDGEGRPLKVNAASGTNPVTSVTYVSGGSTEPIGAITSIALGSSDSDAFTFDPQTGRPATYRLSVNGKADIGTLTWNPNGTLGKFVIGDAIPGTTDNQTCSYLYDDLGRIGLTPGLSSPPKYAANCGTAWQQNFSYDAFGNITKTGSSSFSPAYSTGNTNQFSSIPGVTVSYDANGNLLRDNLNTYTWDANWGNPAKINGTSLIYDALGRMVEQQNGTAYTQMLYSQIGKTAIMNGQTLAKAFVALPGGATAIYNSSGLAYYRHADWLGSSRLTSTAARAVYSETAYAPFGEQYASTTTTDPSFTGQNSDTTSTLYDFTFREYSPSQGRWISPDPAGMSAANPSNPQSWNRYAYVNNNPLLATDPLGLDCIYDNEDGTASVYSGDCDPNDGRNGYYVDGTVDMNSTFTLNSDGTLDFGYTDGSGAYGVFSQDGFGPIWVPGTTVDVYANGDVPIYGLMGHGAEILAAAGQQASHDLGCAGLGWTVAGASQLASAPIIPKPAVLGSTRSGTSVASKVLRGIKNPFGSLPTPEGMPGTSSFAWTATSDLGAFAARWLPYAGSILGAIKMNQCLSSTPTVK